MGRKKYLVLVYLFALFVLDCQVGITVQKIWGKEEK
jgi:hypothetical protein